MDRESPKGFEGALQLRLEEAERSLGSARTTAIVALAVALLSLLTAGYVLANKPKAPIDAAATSAATLEARMASMRNELDALAERAKQQVAAVTAVKTESTKEIRATKIIVASGGDRLELMPFGLSLTTTIGTKEHQVFVAMQHDGTATMQLGGVRDESKILVNGGEPSVTLMDSLGQDRAVLGVAHTVTKGDGATTRSSPAKLTMFDPDGNVVLAVPTR